MNSDHPLPNEIDNYVHRKLDSKSWVDIARHINKCPECKALVRAHQNHQKLANIIHKDLVESLDDTDEHLSYEEMINHLEDRGEISPSKLIHLQHCLLCKEQKSEIDEVIAYRYKMPPPYDWNTWKRTKGQGRRLNSYVKWAVFAGLPCAIISLVANYFGKDAVNGSFNQIALLINHILQAIFIILLIMAMPRPRLSAKEAFERDNMVVLQFRKTALYIYSFFLIEYCFFLIIPISNILKIKWLSQFGDYLVNASGLFVTGFFFLAYYVLTYPSIGELRIDSRPLRIWIDNTDDFNKEGKSAGLMFLGLVKGVFLVCSLLALIDAVYRFFGSAIIESFEQRSQHIAIFEGTLSSVLFCLVATRLDIKHLSLPYWLSPLLSLYASIQILHAFFSTIPMYNWLSPLNFWIAAVGKGYLYLVIAYVIQTGRMTLMIHNINKVDGLNQSIPIMEGVPSELSYLMENENLNIYG